MTNWKKQIHQLSYMENIKYWLMIEDWIIHR